MNGVCLLFPIPAGLSAEPARLPHAPLVFPASGRMEWGLQDRLRIAEFHWPRTLVGYPVHFGNPAQKEALRLRDEVTGEDVAYQLRRLSDSDAMLYFFTDLLSCGAHRWVL